MAEFITTLDVTVHRYTSPDGEKFIKVRVGAKVICGLRWVESVTPDAVSPKWFIFSPLEHFQAVGTNELDAVENTLKILGYKK